MKDPFSLKEKTILDDLKECIKKLDREITKRPINEVSNSIEYQSPIFADGAKRLLLEAERYVFSDRKTKIYYSIWEDMFLMDLDSPHSSLIVWDRVLPDLKKALNKAASNIIRTWH